MPYQVTIEWEPGPGTVIGPTPTPIDASTFDGVTSDNFGTDAFGFFQAGADGMQHYSHVPYAGVRLIRVSWMPGEQ